MSFFNAAQIEILEMLKKSVRTINELDYECISGFEDGCKAYFNSSICRPIEIVAFMSKNTQNNIPYSQALSKVRKLWGTENFIEDSLSPDTIFNHGFHQGNGNHGLTSQKRFETEQEFANVMAAKDIYLFGSHPHQVLLPNSLFSFYFSFIFDFRA